MERLSISSFLHHGHPYHLYVYDDIDVPDGVVLQDADEIIPRGQIFKQYGERESYAGFANLFRYKLLLDKGGIWADTDIVCLKPITYGMKCVFVAERPWPDIIQANNCFIKVPAESEVMELCYYTAVCKDNSKLRWGETGPQLLTRAIQGFDLEGFIVDDCCSVSWQDWRQFIDGSKIDLTGTMIHFYQEMWRRDGIDKDADFGDCVYEQLKKAYL
ncbi:MAG: glycosyltransferase [candidate division Zixibacteria bacterium]